jgi:hypothetical protein
MNREDCVAPDYDRLTPFKTGPAKPFPIYQDLVGTLAAATIHPDETIAHVMAICSAYAYSDVETVASMMARMGLEENHCAMFEEYVDAMFITSTAFLVQSRDGRAVILCYRGTPATSLITWLTDANLEPTRIKVHSPSGNREGYVHGGFYRNVRSTRYEILNALERAIDGLSVQPPDEQEPEHDTQALEHGMQALYITGHSLGAASAAMLALMLVSDPDYEPVREKLKAVYTFGGPMIASREIAEDCDQDPFLHEQVIRYVYDNDVIPQLPPKESGEYAHFGAGYQYKPKQKRWEHNDAPRKQLGDLLKLAASPLTLFAGDLKLTGRLQFHASLRDHLPQYYIAASTPPHIRSEFGD